MRVFISFSQKDRDFALKLRDNLSMQNDIDIIITDEDEFEFGRELRNRIRHKIIDSDYFIIILSRYSIKSKYLRIELDRFIFEEIKSERQTIIPIAVDEYAYEFPILPEISRREIINFSKDWDSGLKSLLLKLNQANKPKIYIKEADPNEIKKINDDHLRELKKEFTKGNLCLFAGAGISIKAGIPNWSLLLKGLLQNLVDKQLGSLSLDPKRQKDLAEFYYDEFGVSSLIVGQYLKNGLNETFLTDVRDALYVNNPQTSDMLDAIVELCRPQREKKSLNAIITFNFDDLIEVNLDNQRIKYKSIFSEGHRATNSEIPIYHPHGYLPRNKELTIDNEIVFSEDAYHSQFIDPFSWSNLVQLNQLSNTTCLLAGISLTDPNLRRLLDVSMRKNPDKQLRHYIFKKRYNADEILKKLSDSELKQDKKFLTKNLIYMTELLEEQDARKLGLNVIWVNSFEDISEFLKKLVND